MGHFLKNIVITGGAGTLGKALTKRLLEKKWVEKITIVSRDEQKHELMQSEIDDERVKYKIVDIKDFEALLDCFLDTDTIVHAAASKRVCNGESSPDSYIFNNIIGTQNVLKACRYSGVMRALMVSTDKAVDPISVYGATKFIGERLWRNAQVQYPDRSFSVVRYGNVFSSNGSIFERWQREENHHCADVTRFWLSPQQAAELCFFALDNMEGGETFMYPGFACSLKDLHDELFPKKDVKPFYIQPVEKQHETLYRDEGTLFKVGEYLVQVPDCFKDVVPAWNKKSPLHFIDDRQSMTSEIYSQKTSNLSNEIAEMRETIWEG